MLSCDTVTLSSILGSLGLVSLSKSSEGLISLLGWVISSRGWLSISSFSVGVLVLRLILEGWWWLSVIIGFAHVFTLNSVTFGVLSWWSLLSLG